MMSAVRPLLAAAAPGQAVNAVLLPKFLGILPFDQANRGAQEAAKVALDAGLGDSYFFYFTWGFSSR